MMRTLTTLLLLLLCFAWSQAAASPPAIVSPSAAFPDAGHGMGAERDAYASPTLSTDPPPPRIALRS